MAEQFQLVSSARPPELVNRISSILSDPRLQELEASINGSLNFERLQPIGAQLLGVAGGAANSLVQAFLMALLAVLLALDPQAHSSMLLAITPRPARDQMAVLLTDCRSALGGWLAGMTISALTVFLMTAGRP